MMGPKNGILIREATVAEIRPLRHAVLRAGMPIEAANFEGDEELATRHVGAFLASGENVGCATIVRQTWHGEPAWRLRGMAVRFDLERTGIGRRLLEALERIVADDRSAPLLWCNARTPAVPFYVRLGWSTVGEQFEIETAGPHFRMMKRLPSPGN